jgi:digeranylgeranylglycerophospholipid reductase
MKEEYDVVVVGAGPAGGTVSWFLAKKGLDVLMVEKKKAVGIPVTCAEALRKETDEVISLPDYMTGHQVSKQVTYRDYVNISETELHAYMINRTELDRYLASQAVREGTELSIGTEFMNFRKDHGKIETSLKKRGKVKKVLCSILIGADGFGSRVARQAGFAGELRPGDYFTTYQYYMSNVVTEEDTIYFFSFVPYIGNGYAWIFPKRPGTANVGLGLRSRQGGSPRQILDLFLHQNPVAHRKCQHAFPLSQSASTIHSSGPLKKVVDDHLLVIGEAAGHIHPATGEGNYFAILGGKIAAEYCIKSFDEQDFSKELLAQYEVECDKIFGHELMYFEENEME